MWRGALTQIVTGILLVATIQIGDLFELNNVKLAVKLLIAIVITVLVFVYRKKDPGAELGALDGRRAHVRQHRHRASPGADGAAGAR